MSKQAKIATYNSATKLVSRFGLTGLATMACLSMASLAQAQQAYYFPQASSSPVSINYGALSPYNAAPAYPAPPAYAVPSAVPGSFQPYGYGYAAPYASRANVAPKSVFAPYGQPAPVYGIQPGYNYGYAPVPNAGPFVAPYANPAFAPGMANVAMINRGLPMSTPTSAGYPQSYLNVPGAQTFADSKPVKKKSKKKKKKAVPAQISTPTANEQGAAAQVAAAEAALESAPAAAPATTPAAPETVASAEPAATEPVPAPTPPEEPEAVPASVPSPAASAPAAAAPAMPSTGDAASESSANSEQVASAEAPANTPAPAGGARIVFDAGSDDLPQGSTSDLDALAERMAGDQNLKIQVLAYSSGTPDAESQARRKALARGLEVRKYLISKGVRSNRIDVRALGTKSEGGPADRVDIVPTAG